jgi:sialate O-acetylesterase
MDLRSIISFLVLNVQIICDLFQVCCQGSSCSDDALWVPSTISGKSGLTITLTVPGACVGKQVYGLRYLWRETPCLYKQAALYSGTDSNLPSPPYLKLF